MVYKWTNIAQAAEAIGADKICIAYNTDNVNPCNWYFNNEGPIDDYYNFDAGLDLHDHPRTHYDRGALKRFTYIPVDWPLMNDKSASGRDNALGRWAIYEAIDPMLRAACYRKCDWIPYNRMNLHSVWCGECDSCLMYKWYEYFSTQGLSGRQMDNKYMQECRIGPYYDAAQSNMTDRVNFYENYRTQLLGI